MEEVRPGEGKLGRDYFCGRTGEVEASAPDSLGGSRKSENGRRKGRETMSLGLAMPGTRKRRKNRVGKRESTYHRLDLQQCLPG